VPKTAGALELRRPRIEPATLALLQELVPNQGQGWQWILDVLGRFFEHVTTQSHLLAKIGGNGRSLIELSDSEPPTEIFEVVGTALHSLGVLGKRTGELHVALASDVNDPAFAPEPLTQPNLDGMVKRLHEQARKVFALLLEKRKTLPPQVQDLTDQVLQTGPGLAARFANLPVKDGALIKIRCHGDYHLGQVLWQENDFVILDFEGEPGRTIAERRAKQSPLKDVAGMLRSLDYAAYSKLLNSSVAHTDDFDRLEPWADVWTTWTCAAFLHEYRRVVSPHGLLPADADVICRLLNFFMLDKTLFELQYELNYRPDWVRIPMLGILHLARAREC
jgi:maltose alpha-D-glucosyltransferase/alpha-amylase